jgi:hypothetical protein
METNTQEIADVLLRLEEPFDKDEVKWLVAATSRDGRKGRVTPYANPRAYTDRLNEVLTASGWTRQYTVHTISPVTRVKKDKTIQTGKVLVTCTVTIAGIGSHSGSGEEWADDENAMTSADVVAPRRLLMLLTACFALLAVLLSGVGGLRSLCLFSQPAHAGNGNPLGLGGFARESSVLYRCRHCG